MEGVNNVTLLIQILVGGILVLSSYAWAFTKRNVADLWGGVRWPCVQWSWAVSGVTTAFAFLYLSGVFLFDETIAPEVDYAVLNASYAAILLPAALWARITFGVINGRTPTLVLFLDLFLVAAGSMGILFSVASLERPWMNVAAAILVFQHLFLDHILWFVLFSQWQEDRFNMRLENARDADVLI